ncbi:MAG: hypothetical protein R3E89_18735, partial [Thiolinea sp.]
MLENGLIPDPYWRDTEPTLDWVHESAWLASQRFILPDSLSGHYTLSFTGLDCEASILLNGMEIGQCSNQFLRHDFEVSAQLQAGENQLQVQFHSNSAAAKARYERFPFAVPYIAHNCRLAHYNFLRKTQCHAGWDWGIALSPLGIYGEVQLRQHQQLRLDEVLIRQQHDQQAQWVRLELDLFYTAWDSAEVAASLQICGQTMQTRVQVYPGSQQLSLQIEVDKPELWWPAGEGAQTLHTLVIRLGEAQ